MFFNNFNYSFTILEKDFFLSPSKKKTTSPCFFSHLDLPALAFCLFFSPTFPKCKNIGSMWLVYAPYISLTFMVHTVIKYTSTWKLWDQKHTKGLKRLYVHIKNIYDTCLGFVVYPKRFRSISYKYVYIYTYVDVLLRSTILQLQVQ